MEPVTFMVIAAVVTAAAQAYQSEQARGANKKKLKELEADFNKLVPPEYDLSIMDPPEYIQQTLQSPSFEMGEITPEQFKLVGKYKPDLAPFILEKNPELIKETAGMKEGRKAQLDALRQLKRVSSEQGDPELAQAMSQAAKQSQIESQSRSASILQDMARRGTMGAGVGLAADLQGQSDSMERAASASRQAAVESYRNRLQALRDSASLGGQIRDQDFRMEGANTDIINSFNERTSKRRQSWENDRVGILNDAQRYNLNAEQAIANANTEQNNRARYNERDRRDGLLKYLYENKRGERDYLNYIAENEAKWRRGERDNANQLKAKQFDDDYRLTAGRQGLAMEGMEMNNQAAQDRNAAIQGVGNAATSYYSYKQSQADRQREEEERRRRYGEY